MAEDRESSDRKHEKSKKRDRGRRRKAKVDPKIWTEEEKLQLAEAIDMFGTADPKRLAERVPTKKLPLVVQKLRLLRQQNRKETESKDMCSLPFVDLNSMDDLFVVGGTKPREVLAKWMEYLEVFYNKEPYQYDKFKMFSNAFLIMSECTSKIMAVENDDGIIDFKKVYYFLYRVFNNFYLSKHHKDEDMKKYLHDMFLRVLKEIDYTSDNEKIAMYNIVSNWTSVNRSNRVKVYGKIVPKVEFGHEEDVEKNMKKTELKVMQQPMIPSFNPLRLKSISLSDSSS